MEPSFLIKQRLPISCDNSRFQYWCLQHLLLMLFIKIQCEHNMVEIKLYRARDCGRCAKGIIKNKIGMLKRTHRYPHLFGYIGSVRSGIWTGRIFAGASAVDNPRLPPLYIARAQHIVERDNLLAMRQVIGIYGKIIPPIPLWWLCANQRQNQ